MSQGSIFNPLFTLDQPSNYWQGEDLPALEALANSDDSVLQEQAVWSIKAIKSRECSSFS